jgi:hypothetical protein
VSLAFLASRFPQAILYLVSSFKLNADSEQQT